MHSAFVRGWLLKKILGVRITSVTRLEQRTVLPPRILHIVLAGLYFSLGVIDLAIFGIVFDKKADFLTSYIKTVCIAILAIGIGASNLIAALLLRERQDKPPSSRSGWELVSNQAVHLKFLDPFTAFVLALTVVRFSWNYHSP